MMREALFQRKTISHFKFDLHDAVQRQVADKPGIPAARQACSIPQPEGEKKKKGKSKERHGQGVRIGSKRLGQLAKAINAGLDIGRNTSYQQVSNSLAKTSACLPCSVIALSQGLQLL